MLATLVAAPFDKPGWVYEEKVDGFRMVAHKEGPRVSLTSRQGKDFTRRFPELATALASEGGLTVLGTVTDRVPAGSARFVEAGRVINLAEPGYVAF